jgi:hypothetical protein
MNKKIIFAYLIFALNSNNFIKAMENEKQQEKKESLLQNERVVKISSINRKLVDSKAVKDLIKDSKENINMQPKQTLPSTNLDSKKN